jgi:putative transposase
LIMEFIDTMRAQGHAVESVCRVLREQGCQVAARTYRVWKQPGRVVAARTVSDTVVMDAVRDIAWTTGPDGRRKLSPEGLYGRRKMTAYLRRTSLPEVSRGAVDRAMRSLGLQGIRRDKGVRTTIPAKDGIRAGDLLDWCFTAPAPDLVWVTDFTYVKTWAGFVYVAFILDVFAQKIVAWHASTSKATDLVMVPLRMALWQRDREGHPVIPGQLIQYSDAGSQGGFNWSSQHPVITEVFDGSSSAGSRSGGASTVAIAGCSAAAARGAAVVLDRDRQGADSGAGRGRGRRVAAGRAAVVPQRWGHATVRAGAVVGSLPVLSRA